jgi:WD40 repeat protein
VTLWQAAPGRELRRFAFPPAYTPAVLFSAAGREVRAGPAPRGSVLRWEVATGKPLPFIAAPGGEYADALAVSPDGRAVVVGSSGGSFRIYDASTGKERRRLRLVDRSSSVQALSPGGRLLAFADGTGFVRVADVTSGQELYKRPHDGVRALAFSPNGQLLAGAGSGPVRLWWAASGKELPGLPGHGDEGQTTAIAFAPNGRALASSGSDGTIRIWEVATRAERLRFQPSAPATCLAFSADGTALASGHFDTTILVWDLTSQLRRAPRP